MLENFKLIFSIPKCNKRLAIRIQNYFDTLLSNATNLNSTFKLSEPYINRIIVRGWLIDHYQYEGKNIPTPLVISAQKFIDCIKIS